MADYLSRKNFIVLDELGYLPFAQSGGQQSRLNVRHEGAKQTRLCVRLFTLEHSHPSKRLYIILKVSADRTARQKWRAPIRWESNTDEGSKSNYGDNLR